MSLYRILITEFSQQFQLMKISESFLYKIQRHNESMKYFFLIRLITVNLLIDIEKCERYVCESIS